MYIPVKVHVSHRQIEIPPAVKTDHVIKTINQQQVQTQKILFVLVKILAHFQICLFIISGIIGFYILFFQFVRHTFPSVGAGQAVKVNSFV